MAITTVSSHVVSVNAIQGTLIADNAITAVHIATNAVSGTLIADNAITAVHVAQNSITVTQLADDCVESDKIADGVITTNHLNKAMISSQPEVTPVAGDFVLLGDTSDSNNLKKAPLTLLLNSNVDLSGKLNLSGGTMTGNLTAPNLIASTSVYSNNGVYYGATTLNLKDSSSASFLSFASNKNATFAGKVGIGTDNPVAGIHLTKSTSGNYLRMDDGSNGGLQIKADTSAVIMEFITTGFAAFETADLRANEFIFKSSATNELVRINGSGVGIGTTNPQYKLDVYGTDDITMRIHRPSSALGLNDTCGIGFSQRGDTNTSTSDTRAGIFSTYNGSLHLCTEPGGNLNSNPVDHAALSIDGTDQNIGIGTTSPSKPLHLKRTSGWATMRLEGASDSGGELEFYKGSTKAGAIFFDNSNNLNIRTSNTERMRIYSDGQVTKPYQSGFYAVKSNGQTISVNQAVIFNTTTENVGGDYNTSNGVYTAPYSGFYIFSYTILLGASLSNDIDVDHYLKTSNRNYIGGMPGRIRYLSSGATGWGDGYMGLGHVQIAYMDAGDTAYVDFSQLYYNNSNGTAPVYANTGNNWTKFSGYFLG